MTILIDVENKPLKQRLKEKRRFIKKTFKTCSHSLSYRNIICFINLYYFPFIHKTHSILWFTEQKERFYFHVVFVYFPNLLVWIHKICIIRLGIFKTFFFLGLISLNILFYSQGWKNSIFIKLEPVFHGYITTVVNPWMQLLLIRLNSLHIFPRIKLKYTLNS